VYDNGRYIDDVVETLERVLVEHVIWEEGLMERYGYELYMIHRMTHAWMLEVYGSLFYLDIIDTGIFDIVVEVIRVHHDILDSIWERWLYRRVIEE